MPKTRSGEKISWKQFMARWRLGIINLTPVQKLKNELISTGISEVGYIVGLVALIIFRNKLLVSWFAYGLILIFVGSVWSTAIKWLTIKQQLNFFKGMNNNSTDINELLTKMEKEEGMIKESTYIQKAKDRVIMEGKNGTI